MTFSFTHDNRTWEVSTKVGDGLTHVEFKETDPAPQEQPIEPGEEQG